MDGYGVRAEDVTNASESAPVSLEVMGARLAGGDDALALSPGKAVRIMTGAVIPPGVDAVVIRENTDESDVREDATGIVRVKKPAKRGENIRRQGEDCAVGERVGARGDVVTPG